MSTYTIKENGITFIQGNDSVKANWKGVDRKFLSLFTEYCNKNGITEVYITSCYRPDAKGSYHYTGQAFDIHSIKYKTGKTIYFTVYGGLHKNVEDDIFFKSISSYFSKYLVEYITPARVFTRNTDRMNKYRDYPQDKKDAERKKLDTGIPYETDRNHLHHLHFAINPDLSAKVIRKTKDLIVNTVKKKTDNTILIAMGMILLTTGIILYKKGKLK